MRAQSTVVAALVFFVLMAYADAAHAQRRGRPGLAGASAPHIIVELQGGWLETGRFLEQLVVVDLGLHDPLFVGERELTTNDAFVIGGSVGYWPWAQTGVHLGLNWARRELEFRDNTGTGSRILDEDDLADLSSWVLSLELVRLLVDRPWRVVPYATAGVSGVWWRLSDQDARDEIRRNDSGTRFRVGAVGGVGARYRASDRVGLRLEFAAFALGNPFDGRDSFTTTSGRILKLPNVYDSTVLPIDEPDVVSLFRITLGVTYLFPLRR